MKWIYVPVGITLLALYTGLNYYIGLRGAQAFASVLGPRGLKIWWFLFWVMAYLYITMRFMQSRIPPAMGRWLIHIGAYWMAVMVYALMGILVVELGRISLTLAGVDINQVPWTKTIAGILVMAAVAGTIIYGTWNARSPRVVHYEVNLSKNQGDKSEEKTIQTALVSDIHLGTIMGKTRLQILVDQLNQMEPDLILFGGDIIDENVNHFIDDNMDVLLRTLNPPLGKYAILGNHEYFGGHLADIVLHLEHSDIKVLQDEGVMVEDLFFLAGREDLVSERMTGRVRKPLTEVLEGIDPAVTPVVVLDHQPKAWEEARDLGVVLQLSGHTHRGQMFPFGYVTERLFPEDWGKLVEKDSTLIVSSGYGTWGPPVRTGNKPEIVMINLKYNETK